MQHYDVIIIGAGAAGMMCALQAGRRDRRTLLLDHGDKPGRKILISGGGRCNFTNIHATAANYISQNAHFAKSALARYTPHDFIALVEKHNIRYHEKTLGQLFCDDSAKQIVAMLERECAEAHVTTRCNTTVRSVERTNDIFRLRTSTGDVTCTSLVIASGGLSIPKLGATPFGYELAKQFGHTIVAPRAGLVPLVLATNDLAEWSDLSGVSTEVTAQAVAKKAPVFREKLLITHRGLSGPAVLQASSYWTQGGDVTFDLAPGRDLLAPLFAKNAQRTPTALTAALRAVLPGRMAERWTATRRHLDWTNAGLAKLEDELHHWTLRPAGCEGFAKAEVTVGGVNTNELDARTMCSKRTPGLYFIGEVVDVTGWLGGFNFQWAWASAVAAGQSV